MDRIPSVLIVDDNPITVETLADLLGQENYTLLTADCGRDAIALALQERPDVILLDVMMPDMDGMAVCRRMRADRQLDDTVIVMVTALDDRHTRIKAVEAGADDFVGKPFNNLELRARVKTLSHLTMQRRARKHELRQERDLNKAILEAVGEAVLVTDKLGRVLFANPAVERLTGHGQAGLIEESFFDLEIAGDLVMQRPQIELVIADGAVWHGEVPGACRLGKSIDVTITFAMLPDPSNAGESMGMVIAMQDVSTLKEAERAKSRFIHSVSHELRTPLSVAMLKGGNLESLYDRLSDKKRKAMISELRGSLRSLDGIVGQVVETARIDHEEPESLLSTVDLSHFIPAQCAAQKPIADEKDLTLQVLGSGHVYVRASEQHLRLMTQNLIGNAIKYTPEGGLVQCEFAALYDGDWSSSWPRGERAPDGAWAGIRVLDSGIGISQEQLGKVFDRFYKTQTQSSIPGAGLGLSLVRELVELYSGFSAVSSSPGTGSTFAIYLPLMEEKT